MNKIVIASSLVIVAASAAIAAVTLPSVNSPTGPVQVHPVIAVDENGAYPGQLAQLQQVPSVNSPSGPVAAMPVIPVDPDGNYAGPSAAFPRFAGSSVYAGIDCLAGPVSSAGAGELISAVSPAGMITADTSPPTQLTDYPYGTCLFTATAATDRGYLGTNTVAARFGKGACKFHARIFIDTLSDGTDTYDLRVGFQDSTTITSVDGAFLHYSSASNSGEWEAISVNNSVSTGSIKDTNSLVAAGVWYIVDIDVNADGTLATYRLNGSPIATNTTNLPTGVNRDFGWGVQVAKSLGAGTKTVSVDYFEGTCIPTTARG